MPGLRLDHADRQIGIPTVQVHRLHAAQHLHPQLGIMVQEPFQGGQNKMRGQVVRSGQADNPGDMPLQLRRFAERQASVFQRLRPREQGFAIVGQAIAALMAAEERNVQRLLQPIQPAGDRGNPHVHLVGGAAQRSRPGDGEEYARIIPVKFCGHLFSIYGKRLSVFRSFLSVSQG